MPPCFLFFLVRGGGGHLGVVLKGNQEEYMGPSSPGLINWVMLIVGAKFAMDPSALENASL